MVKLTIDLNNNPGALEDSEYTRSQPGYVGGGGRFARFETPEHGIAAQEKLLAGRTYAGGGLSPQQILDRYTPAGKENSPESRANYIAYIAQQAGVDPHKPTPVAKVPALAKAMREFETGRGKAPVKGGSKVSLSDQLGASLGVKPYEPGTPTPGEAMQMDPLAAAPDAVADLAKPDIAGIREGVTNVQKAGTDYAGFLQGAVEQIHTNSAQVTASLAAAANTKLDIAQNMATRNEQLNERMKGFNIRKTALLDRIDEVHRLGTLERKVKATFNQDYDLDVLQGRLRQVDEQIKAHESIYTDENARQAAVAASVLDAGAAHQSVIESATKGIAADAAILGQISGAVSSVAANNLLPMQTQAEVLRGREIAKKQIMGTLSTEQLVSGFNDATASPDGTITIQGSTFTRGELQDASRNAQSQDMNFISLRHAHDAGDLQHADSVETVFINHMTPEQLVEANKNGGKYNGVQLSLTKLAAATSAATSMREGQVEQVVLGTAVGIADSTLRTLNAGMDQGLTRATEMFGNAPGELTHYKSEVLTGMGYWQNGYKEAVKRGVGNEYIRSNMPQIIAYRDGFEKVIDGIATKWGAGKPELAAVASAYLRGNPLNGDAATKGLIMLASSGMPAGATISGPAKAALAAVRLVVEKANTDGQIGAGTDIGAALLNPQTKQTANQLLRDAQAASNRAYGNAMTEQLFKSMPDIAKRLRVPGQPGNLHPFARVSSEDFQMAVQMGDRIALTNAAEKLGVKPENVTGIMAGGVNGAGWKKVAEDQNFTSEQFTQISRSMKSDSDVGMLQALDASHSARPGFVPSTAYIDFLRDPQTMNAIDGVVNNYGRSNFGSFVASSASGGGYRDAFRGYVDRVAGASAAHQSTDLAERMRQQRTLAGDPFKRFQAVAMVSGLSKSESQLLAKELQPLVRLPEEPTLRGLVTMHQYGTPRQRTIGQFDAITTVIKSHKFDNPVIESLRRRVLANWDASHVAVGAVSDSLAGDD